MGLRSFKRFALSAERVNTLGEGDLIGGPLSGSEVVVTRPAHSAGPMVERLRALGALVIEAPMITLAPPPEPDVLGARLSQLVADKEPLGVDWLLLTSVNAAQVTLETLQEVTGGDAIGALQQLDARGLKVACVGETTARYLRSRSIEVTVTPERYIAEGLFEALSTAPLKGARLLFPRALKAREWLVEQLEAHGAIVELIPAYQTLSVALSPALKLKLERPAQDGLRRILTFTSDSTAASFIAQWEGEEELGEAWREVFHSAQTCVIGPTVAAYLKRRGLAVDAIATPHSVEGLMEALIRLMR